jgi:hypothetical protein
MPELESVIEAIRVMNPKKGVYGGEGWANYAAAYFNDVQRFFEGFSNKMKRSGVIVWVIGNSILQGIEVKTDEFTSKVALKNGFVSSDGGIHILREKRNGSSIVSSSVRANAPKKPTHLYEAAVILRRN